MVSKMLTAIKTLEQQYSTAELLVEGTYAQRQISYEYWKNRGIIHLPYHSLPFINVQRLMFYNNVIQSFIRTTILPPQERKRQIHQLFLTITEEAQYKHKPYLLVQTIKTQQIRIDHETRLKKRLQEVEERLLSPTAINLIDHTTLCMLDKLLWESYPEQVQHITQQLEQIVANKAKSIQPLTGYEALQKQLLQLYVPMFMTFPYGMNMLALRVSALTIPILMGKSASLYYAGASQAQAMKQKATLISCEKRRTETKQISSGKSSYESVPQKYFQDATGAITTQEKVGTIRDRKKQHLLLIALRYAYGLPYWIRRMIAMHYGTPEEVETIKHFSIFALTKRKTRMDKLLSRYPEARFLTYSRDEQVMKIIRKYQSRYGNYYPRRGKYRTKRRV